MEKRKDGNQKRKERVERILNKSVKTERKGKKLGKNEKYQEEEKTRDYQELESFPLTRILPPPPTSPQSFATSSTRVAF